MTTFSSRAHAGRYKIENRGDGYCYMLGMKCIPDFTEDGNSILPNDKQVAEHRFKRRKDFVEKWYAKYRLEDLKTENAVVVFAKAILMLPLTPIIFIAEGVAHNQQDSPEAIEMQKIENEEYRFALDEMRNFIIKDCQFESEL